MAKKTSPVNKSIKKNLSKAKEVTIEKPSLKTSFGKSSRGNPKATSQPSSQKRIRKTSAPRAISLEEKVAQREAELAIINSVQEGLASKLDIQTIYELVGDKVREIFSADTTFIAFKDKEKNLLVCPYYSDQSLKQTLIRPYGDGLAEVIIESGKPLLLGTEEEQEQYSVFHIPSPGAESDLNQSFLGVPIFINSTTGVLNVQSYKKYAYDENDQRLLQTLANSMSVALENA